MLILIFFVALHYLTTKLRFSYTPFKNFILTLIKLTSNFNRDKRRCLGHQQPTKNRWFGLQLTKCSVLSWPFSTGGSNKSPISTLIFMLIFVCQYDATKFFCVFFIFIWKKWSKRRKKYKLIWLSLIFFSMAFKIYLFLYLIKSFFCVVVGCWMLVNANYYWQHKNLNIFMLKYIKIVGHCCYFYYHFFLYTKYIQS